MNKKNETTGGEHNAENPNPLHKMDYEILDKPIKIQRDYIFSTRGPNGEIIDVGVGTKEYELELSRKEAERVIEAYNKDNNRIKEEGRQGQRTLKDKENQGKIDELKYIFEQYKTCVIADDMMHNSKYEPTLSDEEYDKHILELQLDMFQRCVQVIKDL